MLQSRAQKRESQAEDPVTHNLSEPAEWLQIKTPSTIIGRRCCHASCFFNDELYIYGGYDNNSPGIFSDMFVYSFKDATWKTINQQGQTPGKRHSQSAVLYQNAIFMFGGMTSVMNNTNMLHKFDIQKKLWKKITTTNTPLSIDSHKAVVLEDRMIVGMGYCQNEYNSKIYQLNFTKMQWKCLFNPKYHKINEYPKARAHGSFNLQNKSIYIYGGKDFNSIFSDLWKFDLETNKYSKIELINPLSGRFGHSGVIHQEKLFIFGGTKGVAHQRNDLIIINFHTKYVHTCWPDSQEELIRAKQQQSPVAKKSRRDSVKKFGVDFYDSQNNEVVKCNQSPGKYRNQLKDVNYYNELYQNRKKENQTLKKTRRNPFLTEFEGIQNNQSLNLTSTFQILTNSIMLTMGKTSSRQQKSELNFQNFKRVPKARDNYSVDIDCGQHPKMIIFGGGMHKVSYNDLILIDIKSVINRHLPH